MLGGFGLPAEVGLAAFDRLRDDGLISLEHPASSGDLERALRRPISVRGRDRPVRYRFPRQRASRISAALEFLAANPSPGGASELRDWLQQIPGVGPKTASWVVRNWLGADGVAIIDLHVRRAGVAAGFFPSGWSLPRHYARFEAAFCAVADLGGVSSAALDAKIWNDLAFLGNAWPLLIGNRSAAPEASLTL
jgi:N-glycosylase/DNA lyase